MKSVFDLEPAQKLQLVQDLWDDLSSSPDDVPVESWQLEEVERRRANLMANPASGLTFEQIKQRIQARHEA